MAEFVRFVLLYVLILLSIAVVVLYAVSGAERFIPTPTPCFEGAIRVNA
jgi:asparagine N-glycosylation enzyme membrane subunit Stt3